MFLFLDANLTVGVTVTGANFTKLFGFKHEKALSEAERKELEAPEDDKLQDMGSVIDATARAKYPILVAMIRDLRAFGAINGIGQMMKAQIDAEITTHDKTLRTNVLKAVLKDDALAAEFEKLKPGTKPSAALTQKIFYATSDAQTIALFEKGRKAGLWADVEEMESVVNQYATAGISVQADFGWNVKFRENIHFHFVGSFGKTFKQQSAYFKPGMFGQLSIEPTYMLKENIGVFALVGIRHTRNVYATDHDLHKDIKSLNSVPVGFGINYAVGKNTRMSLKYFYNYTWGGDEFSDDKEKTTHYYAAQSFSSHNVAVGLTWMK
ncbi:MAG: hypothetical protein H6850_01540 [Alphaproteobacteria bacterium]|nr:MAG: hypothetical protein H6850_01540 [Alphaproteobacteria bacterium]